MSTLTRSRYISNRVMPGPNARQARVYRTVSIESAAPPAHRRALARALRDIDDARRAIGAKDFKAKGMALSHALAIFGELAGALDHARSPELCANLASLYDFIGSQLTAANVGMTAQPLDGAEKVVRTLRESFEQAGRS